MVSIKELYSDVVTGLHAEPSLPTIADTPGNRPNGLL